MRKKKYSGDIKTYENKLNRVMERFGVDTYNYGWNKDSCFIEFTYKNQNYRFEHSLTKAAEHNQDINYVSDLFAQLVMSLEDIARMTERGIYELSAWIEGMKTLPQPKSIPQCFMILGFIEVPTVAELKSQFRKLAKESHPDNGGNSELFCSYQRAYAEAEEYLKECN